MLAAALLSSGGRLQAQHEHPSPGRAMTMASMRGPLGVPQTRLGSGTSWIPDSSAVRAITAMRGAWMISFHGAVNALRVDQRTKRGDAQFGMTDWEMLMAMRTVRGGLLRLNVMTSLEALTLGGSGYPLLLQTGGTYRHSPLRDRQHPHNVVMELAAVYERAF